MTANRPSYSSILSLRIQTCSDTKGIRIQFSYGVESRVYFLDPGNVCLREGLIVFLDRICRMRLL